VWYRAYFQPHFEDNSPTAMGQLVHGDCPEPKKRAWRHGRAWKMKIRA